MPRVYCVQLDSVWEKKEANFAKTEELLNRQPIEPGSLVVLPEMFATGFSMDQQLTGRGEPERTEAFLRRLAAQHRAYIHAGMTVLAQDGLGKNLAVVSSPGGEIVARYHKLHPFPVAGETAHYHAGSEIVSYDWHGFRMVPFICYDLRFPEIFRHAAQRGADGFVVIACWPRVRIAQWTALLKARAIENQAYVIGVNRCGTDPRFSYNGQTAVIDPQGNTVSEAGSGEGVITADLDLNTVNAFRELLPVLRDIRREYKFA